MCLTESDLLEYNKQQVGEMLGPYNKYFAGQAVGHGPTPEEAAWHYVQHGGPDDFRKRWEASHQRTS